MIRRQYQLSQEAAEDSRIQELADLIDKTRDHNYDVDGPDIVSFREGYFAIEDEPDDRAERLLGSKLFHQLTNAKKHEVFDALTIDETRTWGLDLVSDPGSQLVDIKAPRLHLAAHAIDALVLSGAVGYEISSHFKKVDALAERIESDVLRRNILIGGVTLDRFKGARWSELGYQSYDTLDAGGELAYRTWVGADMHGDFRTVRQTIFRSSAIDPLGREQVFGPNEEVFVGAYHSIEPAILSALLEYQIVYAGLNRRDLFDVISKKLELVDRRRGHDNNPFGPLFADFGQDDGHYDAMLLQMNLNEANSEPGRMLIDTPTGPGEAMKVRLQLIAEDNGVTFTNTSGQYADSNSQFTVPKSEINNYIALLMSTESGRTSMRTMDAVLCALVTTDDRI